MVRPSRNGMLLVPVFSDVQQTALASKKLATPKIALCNRQIAIPTSFPPLKLTTTTTVVQTVHYCYYYSCYCYCDDDDDDDDNDDGGGDDDDDGFEKETYGSKIWELKIDAFTASCNIPYF